MIVRHPSHPALPSDVRKVFDLPELAESFGASPLNWGTAPLIGEPAIRWGSAASAHQVAKPRQMPLARILAAFFRLSFMIAILPFAANIGVAQPKITIAHNDNKTANPEFKFANIPSPSRDDAATRARVVIVDGEADANGGDVTALVDGALPTSGDQPQLNFFVAAGSGGARVLMDLGRVIDIGAIDSYSWHPDSRASQVYRIWGSDGSDPQFKAEPKANVDPRGCGWKVIATVDTRSSDEDKDGGQFGVSVTDATGSIGRFRYLLFDFYVTEVADNFGNTFYSEIDVIANK